MRKMEITHLYREFLNQYSSNEHLYQFIIIILLSFLNKT